MNKFKKWVTSVALSLALITGGSIVAAPAAQAYTTSGGYWVYSCNWGTRTWYTYYDYDWWEETFQWKHDGWYASYTQYYKCYVY